MELCNPYFSKDSDQSTQLSSLDENYVEPNYGENYLESFSVEETLEYKELFQCFKCAKVFSKKEKLSAHFVNAHPVRTMYACSLCTRKFDHLKFLNIHMGKFLKALQQGFLTFFK